MSDAVSSMPTPGAVWLFGGGLIGTRARCLGIFDDPMHQIPGLAVTAFPDLYHRTVGGPVDNSAALLCRLMDTEVPQSSLICGSP